MANETYQDYDILYDEWLERLRVRNPRLSSMPDEVVWKYGQRRFPQESQTVQHPSDYALEEEKTSRWLDEESAGQFIPEPILKVFQKAYNDSLTGFADLVDTGETPYSLIDKNTGKPYDFNLLQDMAAFVGSFVAGPVDWATMYGSLGVGNIVSRGILKGTRKAAINKFSNALVKEGVEKEVAKKMASRRVAEKFSDKHFKSVLKEGWKETFTKASGKKFTETIINPQPFVKRWTSGSAPTAGMLTGYHMVGEASRISLERGRRGPDGKWTPGELTKEDIPSILGEGAIGMATGLTLGALQTAVGANIVGKSRTTQRMMKAGEIGGEIAIFGSMPNLLKGQLPKLNDEGDLVWMKDGKPIQFQDEEGNIRDYTVMEGMKHAAFAVGSLKSYAWGVGKVHKYVGEKWRGRDAEIDNLKKERETFDKIEKETESAELKIELNKQKEKKQEKINSLEKEKIEGFDESSVENILKLEEIVNKRGVPNKSLVDKVEVELEDVRAHIHKVRSELGKGEELPQNIKDLSKAVNIVEKHINNLRENGWKDGSKNIVDKSKPEADRRADLEADFDVFLSQHKEKNQKPKWSTLEEVLDYYNGDINKALDYFNRYYDRQNPVSKSQTEANKKLDKITSKLEKLEKDPKSKESVEKAEADLPSESVRIIDAENVTDVDKGILKSLLNIADYKGKITGGKTNPKVITTLIGETRTFAKWLNTKGKTLKDASQALFNQYIEGRSLSKEARQRYKRQFDALGLEIDLSDIKITVPKEKILLTTKEYQKNIKKTEESLKGEGDINISPKKKISKAMARVIMNLKSRWGHRDNAFYRTAKEGGVKVSDVEVNTKGDPYGIVVTEKGEKPVFRFLEPDISRDVKSLMKGKGKNDLLFSSDGKKSLSTGDMENFSSKFISYGKEGVTGHNIRHFLISAAKVLDTKNKTTEFTEFVDRFLLLHPPGEGSSKLSPSAKHYIKNVTEVLDDFATFKKFMTELKTMKDVDFNKALSKQERMRIADEISAMMTKGEGKPARTEIITGSGEAFDRLSQGIKKGVVEFNDRDPNYRLKDKLADAALVGAEIIAQGAKTLKDFTVEMVNRFGTGVRKYAKDLYEASTNVLNQRPEVQTPNVMKRLGITSEQVKFKAPEIEAEKIVKKIKEQKYDDTPLEKNIITKKIENIAYKKGLTDKKLNDEVFEALGFYDKSGKPSINGVKTKSDLADVYGYIKENYPDFREHGALELGKMIQDTKRNEASIDKAWDGLLGLEMSNKRMGVGKFLRKYGGSSGKWLSKKMDAFMEDYYHLVGMGDMARDSAKKLGLSNKEVNMLGLSDKKAFSSRLTVEQERFQHDMFNVPESPQYKAREIIDTMYGMYFDILLKRVKEKANPRDYENIKNWLTKRKVKDYFTRRVTKEGSDYYKHNDEGRAFIEKAIRRQLYKDVVSKDKKYIDIHKKVKALEKKLKDPSVPDKDVVTKELQSLRVKREARHKELIKEKNVVKLQEKFYDQFNHNPDKLIHPNLDFIRIDLPEFIPSGKHAGKRTHDMSFDATVGGYIESSSKFISAISHFPSLTSWGGKRFKTPLESKLLNLYMDKGKAFGAYAERQVKNLVIGSESIDNKFTNRMLSHWTQYSAVHGLSGFFSGIKNYMIADVMNFATYGLGAFVKGYKYGFTAEGWAEARKIGGLQAGSKHLHEIGLTKPIMKYVSFMEPAEHSNRARARATGMFWLTDALRFKRGERTLWLRRMGSEKFVDQKLKDTFNMEKKDIDFFTKYGMDKDLISMDTPNYDKLISKHDAMMRQLNTQSHRATQGATSVRDLPGWMNQGLGKYTTLFYRMAFSGTSNLINNVFKPAILLNPLPMLRLISMGLGHGTLLWQMKHAVMGTERNSEHVKGDTVSKLFEALMAVETFSLLGSTVDALDREEGRGILQEFMPVIVTNAVNAGTLIGKLYNIPMQSKYTQTAKLKTAGQAFEDYAKQTVVAYNHWSKIRDNLFSGSTGKEIVRYRQASRIIRTFKNDRKVSNQGDYNWDSPLFKALEREILLGGTDAKSMTTAAELYWVARTEIREKLLEESDFKLSHREVDRMARQKIEQSIKNRIGVIPFSMNSPQGRVKIGQLFDAIDKEGAYIIRKAATDGEKRLKIFYRQVNALNSDNRYKNW